MAARGAPLRFAKGFATRPVLCRSYTNTRDTTFHPAWPGPNVFGHVAALPAQSLPKTAARRSVIERRIRLSAASLLRSGPARQLSTHATGAMMPPLLLPGM